MTPETFISQHNNTRRTRWSIKCFIAMAVFFCATATSVFAQSNLFEKLTALEIGREIPEWVVAQGIPVPNTDLTDPGKLLYSFSSQDPIVPNLVTVRQGKITAIQLSIPEEERRRYQELFFASRYDRVQLGQNTKETAYFLPSIQTSIILDTVSGDVLRLEKTSVSPNTVASIPRIQGASKVVAYSVICLSLAAIVILLIALGIEVSHWKPKEDDVQNAPMSV